MTVLPTAPQKPPFVRSPRNLSESEYLREPASANSPMAGIAVAIVVIMVGIGGFLGYKHFNKPATLAPTTLAPAAPAPASASTSASASAPAPASTEAISAGSHATPLSTAGKNLRKANETAAAHGEVTAAVNEVLSETPAASPASTPPAAENPVPAAAPVAVVPAPAPVPVVAPAPPKVEDIPPPPPSPAFRAFVVNMRVSGVFQGDPARALINGQMASVGDTVDHKLGIVFSELNVAKKQMIFQDASGAIMPRKY
jgi:hypothetical protein